MRHSKDYDADRCHLYATGYTVKSLAEKLSNDTREVVPDPACTDGEFYVFSFEEFEGLHPDVKQCAVSTYAAVVQAAALDAPCRTRDKEKAELLMIPSYLASGEFHYPAYGGMGYPNIYRPGTRCMTGSPGTVMTDALLGTRRANPGKRVLAVVAQLAGALPRDKSQDPGVTLAIGNAMFPCHQYRRGLDVSMPPPAPPRADRVPDEAYSEPLGAKRYFASFKGALGRGDRRKLRGQFHNGEDVIITGSDDDEHGFDELLYHSRFNLILHGDQEYSYRFAEAVCSGGVPVLVNSQWVPPFHEFVPFDSYGVLLRVGQQSSLLPTLKNLTDAEVEEKRSRAKTVCRQYFASVKIQTQALIRELLAHPRAPGHAQEQEANETEAQDGGKTTERVYNVPEDPEAELKAVGVYIEEGKRRTFCNGRHFARMFASNRRHAARTFARK